MFNHCVFAGRLTKDPNVRVLPSGMKVASFSLAINRRYKDRNGVVVDKVCYLDCDAWNAFVPTVAQYLRQGSMVLVSGRLEQDSWEDKTTGLKRTKHKLTVEDLKLFPKIGEGERAKKPTIENNDRPEDGKEIPLEDAVIDSNGPNSNDYTGHSEPVTGEDVPF